MSSKKITGLVHEKNFSFLSDSMVMTKLAYLTGVFINAEMEDVMEKISFFVGGQSVMHITYIHHLVNLAKARFKSWLRYIISQIIKSFMQVQNNTLRYPKNYVKIHTLRGIHSKKGLQLYQILQYQYLITKNTVIIPFTSLVQYYCSNSFTRKYVMISLYLYGTYYSFCIK